MIWNIPPLPNPFIPEQVSICTETESSLPSGESDPVVMQDYADAAEKTAVTVENQPAPVLDVTADLTTFWELRAAQIYARGEEVLREINEYRLQAMIEAVNASTEDDEIPLFLRKASG